MFPVLLFFVGSGALSNEEAEALSPELLAPYYICMIGDFIKYFRCVPENAVVKKTSSY